MKRERTAAKAADLYAPISTVRRVKSRLHGKTDRPFCQIETSLMGLALDLYALHLHATSSEFAATGTSPHYQVSFSFRRDDGIQTCGFNTSDARRNGRYPGDDTSEKVVRVLGVAGRIMLKSRATQEFVSVEAYGRLEGVSNHQLLRLVDLDDAQIDQILETYRWTLAD